MQELNVQVPIPVFAQMTERLREELIAAEQQMLESFEAQLIAVQNYSKNDRGMQERQQQLMAQHEACQMRANKIQDASVGGKFLLRILQGNVALKIGDKLVDKLHSEIFVEDGVVTDIRSSAPTEEMVNSRTSTET